MRSGGSWSRLAHCSATSRVNSRAIVERVSRPSRTVTGTLSPPAAWAARAASAPRRPCPGWQASAAPPPAPVLPKRHDYFWKKNVPVGTATLIHVYDVNEAEGYVLFHEKKMEPGAKWSWNQYASGGLENWVKSYTTGRRFKMLFWENMHPTDPDKAKAQARQMPAPKPTPKPVGDALFWLGAEGE